MIERIWRIIRANITDVFTPSSQWDAVELEQLLQQYQENLHHKERYATSAPVYTAEELSHYQALEVPPGASFEQIKASYKNLIKKYHPDKFAHQPDQQKIALEITQRINVAYQYFEKKFAQ
ncbi:MAG: J domain-containing protein [Cytophagales bacterium]|nr:J domain-containing protein [Bernardetiaceae bacterium]MDW8209985.1 J domain-containing protein [Cytophagales bacterium]